MAFPPLGAADASGSTANRPFISCRNVSKSFAGVRVLSDVSFAVDSGEVHCLAGENGCGKSTLIKIICGTYKPDNGCYLEIDGRHYSHMNPTLARSLGVQVIWQDLALFPELSVAENIAFELNLGHLLGLSRRSRLNQLAHNALQRLGVDLDLNLPVRSLSIAQRQLVAIARVLTCDARLIFMDEPTASLSKVESDYLLQIMTSLAASGVAIVFVSHRLNEVITTGKRVTVIRDGRKLGVFPTAGLRPSELAKMMSGVELAARPKKKSKLGDVVLECANLSRYDEFREVSFTIRGGEVVGLTGLVGSGRTELAHVLFGMRRPSGGSFKIFNRKMNFTSNRDAIRAGVAYLSEDRLTLGLVQPQPVAANIIATVLEKISSRLTLVNQKLQNALVRRSVADLDIKLADFQQPLSTLSGGNQQRVALAKWLATAPKLLILDSPTVGVDVKARAGIFNLVREFADRGLAILLISDEPQEVYYQSDRILLMSHGKIIDQFSTSALDLAELEKRVYA